jgi:hypothetical protein
MQACYQQQQQQQHLFQAKVGSSYVLSTLLSFTLEQPTSMRSFEQWLQDHKCATAC